MFGHRYYGTRYYGGRYFGDGGSGVALSFPLGWTRKCPVVIDATKVGSGGVSDFTVLLIRSHFPSEMCSPTSGNNAQSDGGDVRFSADAAGATPLACKIDNFALDTTDGAGDADVRIHVKVPSLSDSVNTTIYVWYNTAGIVSQPSETDTYGGTNAWDTLHCHRYSFDESPGGTAPQYRDSVGTRHATVFPTVSQVTGKQGSAIDGNASGWVRGPWAGHVLPNNSMGGVPATGCGVCLNGDGNLAIAGFDDGVVQTVGEVIVINKVTGAEVSRFNLSSGPTNVQGLAWNSTLGYYAAIGASSGAVYHYNAAGTFIGSITLTGGSNAIAYDSVLNNYWTRQSASQVSRHATTGGAALATLTLTGISPSAAVGGWDGVSHRADDDTLLMTAQNGYIYWVNKSTGAQISSYRGILDQEHAVYDPADGAVWVTGDARYHSGGEAGENVVYKLTTTATPYAWRAPSNEFSAEFWWKPDAITTSTTVLAEYAAVKNGGYYIELQTRASGILRTLDSTLATTDTPASTFTTGTWYWVRLTFDDAADTLTLFKDNVQVSQKTSATYNRGPDGRIGFGARADGTQKHNGAIEEFRLHSSKRSAAWWSTRYNNTNAPASFASVGTPLDGSSFKAAWAIRSNVVFAGAA